MTGTAQRRRELLPARAAGWLLLGVTLLVFAGTVARSGVNTDAYANSLTAWQISHTGRPWMDGLDLTESGEVVHFAQRDDGRFVTTRTPGQIWAAVPFYVGTSDQQSDFSSTQGSLAAATLAAIAVLLVFLACRARLSVGQSVAVAVAYGIATPIWSVNADALWTHCVTVLGCAGAAWALSKDRLWLAGAFFGVAILGRVHLAVIAAVVGLGLTMVRRSPRPVVQVGLTSLLGLVVLVAWNRYVFGVWDIQSGYGKELSSTIPGQSAGLITYFENVAGFLVSPDRGLFVWTPVLLVMLPAVVAAWRHVPDWSRWLTVGAGAYLVIQMALVRDFGGGDAFYGYRYGLELITCLTPLYAFAVPWLGRRARALLPWVLGYQFAVIAIGAIFDGIWVVYTEAWTNSSLFLIWDKAPWMIPAFLVIVGVPAGIIYRRGLQKFEPASAQVVSRLG